VRVRQVHHYLTDISLSWYRQSSMARMMVTMAKTILVTGAGGHVGRSLVDQLAARGARVRASGRNPARLRLPDGVERVRADLTEPDTLPAALDGVDAVFVYAIPAGAEAFAIAAREAGVRHVVLLSSHTLHEVADIPQRRPIADMHEAVEHAIVDAGLPHTFLQPANFASNTLLWGWADTIRAEGVVRFPYPESYSDAIHEADIAAVAAAVLTEPDQHLGESYFISGPRPITQREQAAAIAAALGRPVRIEELTPDQSREYLRRIVPEWVIEATIAWWAATDGAPCEVTDLVAKLTGAPARPFTQWVTDHVADFR
jgi:uncharacterized protein YbjT (DUF2867 family)